MSDKDLRRKKRKARANQVRVHDRMSTNDYERAARCKRCSRRVRKAADSDRWNMVWAKGILTGMVCPNCQTPEEDAEAERALRNMDFMIDQDGRGLEKPKGSTARAHVTCADCSRVDMDNETVDCWYIVHERSTGGFVREGMLEVVSLFELRTSEHLQIFELPVGTVNIDRKGYLCPQCAAKHRLPALV